MSYGIGLCRIDEENIDIEKVKEFCNINSEYIFDVSQEFTNISEITILYINEGGEKSYICSLDYETDWADCITPDDENWNKLSDLADFNNLFVVGEENEIYHIPSIGQPTDHYDFHLAKQSFKKNGHNLNKILEGSKVEHS